MMPGAGPVARAVGGGLARRKVQTLVIGLVAAGIHRCLRAGPRPCCRLQRPVRQGLRRSARRGRGGHRRPGGGYARAARRDSAAAGGHGRGRALSRGDDQPADWRARPGPRLTLQPMTVAGRGGPGGPLDDLVIQQGRWAQRPGELVLSSDSGLGVPLGTQITVSGVPGTPRLTVVGYRQLDQPVGRRLGSAQPDRCAARAGGARDRADAVPVRQRGQRGGAAHRCPRLWRRAALRRADRHAVVPGGQGAGDVGDRPDRAVRGRVRRSSGWSCRC